MPQQALALTNSALFVDQSKSVARMLREEVGGSGFVVAAFEHVLSRRPTAEEEAQCRKFMEQQMEFYREVKPPVDRPERRAGESLIRVLFNHGDFVTIR